METYKGFDKNLKCRGFQFAIGETHTHEGAVETCKSGFHSCEHPLDVFRYYAPAGNRFAIVEPSGDIDKHDEDSKLASSKLHIKAELSFAGIVKAALDYTFSRAKPIDPDSPSSATGDCGASSATGDRGASSATGTGCVAMSIGFSARAMGTASNAIVLVKRNDDGSIRHIRAAVVGEQGVEAGKWYSLDADGNFVEVAAP